MPIGSEPQIISGPLKYNPAKCAVTGRTDGEFIDTGARIMERAPYVYLSTGWVEDQATKLLGMVPKAVVAEEFTKLTDEIAAKDARIAELEHLEEFVKAAKAVASIPELVAAE